MKPKYLNSCRTHFLAWSGAFLLITSLHALSESFGHTTITGNLTVSGSDGNGWGLFKEGIDLGITDGFSLNWSHPLGAPNSTAMFDIDGSTGVYLWRWKNITAAVSTNKMKLDANNVLTLYKSNGSTAGITLNPSTGNIAATSLSATSLSASSLWVGSLSVGNLSSFLENVLYAQQPENMSSIAMTNGTVSSAGYNNYYDYGDVYGAVAMSEGWAGANSSVAITRGETISGAESSTAMSGGVTYGVLSTALSGGYAVGESSTAMSGGEATSLYSTGISGAFAGGAFSFAAGYAASAQSFSSAAFGRYNNSWGSPSSWVETDPLLLVGNGTGWTPSHPTPFPP